MDAPPDPPRSSFDAELGAAVTGSQSGRLARERARAEAEHLIQFRALYARRRPYATCALVGVIAAVFALQAVWGGVDVPPLLASMGSLVPARVRGGEWWRLFACTFLHGGVLHAGLNLLVLAMLGRWLERLVGSARFLCIYFAAGLAGSLTSALFVVGQSVGASGAIWGLLGADAAMAFYPRPLLPPALVGMARRTVVVILVLLLVGSFNPHVDLAAHVGGGLMGAALIAGLAAAGRIPVFGRPAPAPDRWLPPLAVLASVASLGGLVQALAAGRPWQLDAPPVLERVPLPGSPWTLTVPRALGAAQNADGSTEFGDLARDPSTVDVTWGPLSGELSPAELDAELEHVRRRLDEVPEGFERLAPARVVRAGGPGAGSHVTVRYRYAENPALVDDRAIGVVAGSLVRVDVIGWSALPRAFEGLAPRVLGSFELRAASDANHAH
jgi:membrane associated rhomboid family serine protease